MTSAALRLEAIQLASLTKRSPDVFERVLTAAAKIRGDLSHSRRRSASKRAPLTPIDSD